MTKFRNHFPNWAPLRDIETILIELHEANADKWRE
jgi:hypothetical protein